MNLKTDQFKKALSHFASGIAIVTAKNLSSNPGVSPYLGITISSFASLSLDPQLILYCLDKNSSNLKEFSTAPNFVVNFITDKQLDLCKHFASHARNNFENVMFQLSATSKTPVIDGCLAYLECCTKQIFDAGDHVIITAEVIEAIASKNESAKPLIYYKSGFNKIL